MGRDLLTNPYGRFFYLPKLLAERGHGVRIVVLDYEGDAPQTVKSDGIKWVSAPPSRYRQAIRAELETSLADWIVGFSDTYFGIAAAHYARNYGVSACIDAYDNYESYLAWCKPLHWLWRRALSRADLITAAGPALLALMGRQPDGRAGAVVPMAADPTGFVPRDQVDCRKTLELPATGTLVGYCGSLHRSRGVDTLFAAIEKVGHVRDDIRFFHSGRTWRNVPVPGGLTSLGYLPDENVPLFLSSMDAVAVVNRRTSFGEHSYPVKLYEAIACQVPAVATRTLATEWILRENPERLVESEDPDSLAAAIIDAVEHPPVVHPAAKGWGDSCDVFEDALIRSPGR